MCGFLLLKFDFDRLEIWIRSGVIDFHLIEGVGFRWILQKRFPSSLISEEAGIHTPYGFEPTDFP